VEPKRREHVNLARSRDGTEIAYWTRGHGPPLVLVHGAPADHTRWDTLLPYLEPRVTVHAMDRRGRGGSGDGADYALAREFDDVVAVIDAVADESGSAVDVYGHSFGGLCAFGAATMTSRIRKLVLYEGWSPLDPEAQAFPPGVAERIETLLAEGDRDAVVETVFRSYLAMSDEDLDALRSHPSWPGRVEAAQKILREVRAIPEAPFDPALAATITVPTLLLTGEDSHDPAAAEVDAVAAALPDARIVVLEGQEHVADVLAPELVADHVLGFLGEPG
jgi:pimeloyl-ACP methyl ester carboxylesterase